MDTPPDTPTQPVDEREADTVIRFTITGPPHRDHEEAGTVRIDLLPAALEDAAFDLESYLRETAEQKLTELYGYPVEMSDCTVERTEATIEPDQQPPAQEIQMPVLDVMLGGAPINTAINPETGDRAMIVGPVLVRFILPMDAGNARNVARDLSGGIEIAGALSPEVRAAAEQLVRK